MPKTVKNPAPSTLRARLCRQRKAEEMSLLLAKIWNLFPSSALKKLRPDDINIPDTNYGLHQRTLGLHVLTEEYLQQFQEEIREFIPDGNFGAKSLGLRYENEHSVNKYHQDTDVISRKHMDFLNAIAAAISIKFPNYKDIEKYLRVNINAGPRTKWHTDCLRGYTKNYILIQPNSSFILVVRQFPNFHSSVVIHNNQKYIPLHLGNDGLIMIGENEGRPHFYRFRKEVIDELQAFGNLVDFVVVGIKEGKIQVIPTRKEVWESPGDLPLKLIDEVFVQASNHPAKKPKKIFTHLHNTDRFLEFTGWKHAHRWNSFSNHVCRRIHVFYRLVREETSSARLHNYESTGLPKNYTIVE
jgi:hypothetical protein